jgi:ADP-ribose pyrophosphatase
MTIYLATELTAGEQTPMEDERIETRWYTAKEIDGLIHAGKILDAKTQIGFLKWQRYVAGKRTSR